MSHQQERLELARRILEMPAPFRERLIDLMLLWNSVPQAARDDAVRRLHELARTPDHREDWETELLAQLDRLLGELQRFIRE